MFLLLPPLGDKPSIIKAQNNSLCSCGYSHFCIRICITVGFHVSFMITSAPVALYVGPYVQHWHVGVMKTQRRYKLSMLLCSRVQHPTLIIPQYTAAREVANQRVWVTLSCVTVGSIWLCVRNSDFIYLRNEQCLRQQS